MKKKNEEKQVSYLGENSAYKYKEGQCVGKLTNFGGKKKRKVELMVGL